MGLNLLQSSVADRVWLLGYRGPQWVSGRFSIHSACIRVFKATPSVRGALMMNDVRLPPGLSGHSDTDSDRSRPWRRDPHDAQVAHRAQGTKMLPFAHVLTAFALLSTDRESPD